MSNLSIIQWASAALYSNNDKFLRGQGKEPVNNGPVEKKAQLFYRYCKKQGYLIEKCYKLHNFPSGNANKGRIMTTNAHISNDGGSGCFEDGISVDEDKEIS